MLFMGRNLIAEPCDVFTEMSIHPQTRIGHVHLTVSDLDRALAFYRDVLGFEVTSRYGRDAVFLSVGGYHHHIGLNTWAGRGARAPAPGTTGLYHFAILYPDRKTLAGALRRVLDAGVPVEGAADHGVSEAIYLRDPTATASSCIATVRRTSGRAPPTAASRCIRGRWTSRNCWLRRTNRDRGASVRTLGPRTVN